MLLLQVVLVAATSAVFLAAFESFSAVSVWYGGGIAAANALIQARCLRRDRLTPERTPRQTLAAAMICVVQRFAMVALLFILGLGVWQFEPLATLAGFIVGQIAMVISGTQQLTQK
ncbi:MAG: ATP synthase subunit I [Thiogranum sp.]|nr:ATP synthase subunit I [Thiogranum sp.]